MQDERATTTGALNTAATSMSPRSRWAFLALILAQAAHSIEEYLFRLFDVFAPARFVSRLVSNDLAVGFALVNTPSRPGTRPCAVPSRRRSPAAAARIPIVRASQHQQIRRHVVRPGENRGCGVSLRDLALEGNARVCIDRREAFHRRQQRPTLGRGQ
jgi:hypothetical protein